METETPAQPELPAELGWTYNPWRANWCRPVLALLLELVISAIAGWSFTAPNWWPQALSWGLMSQALLLGMTAMIFLPVRYKLSLDGVSVILLGTNTFRKWEHYRNYYVHKKGVYLTTMPQPSALDPFRGHYVQYGPSDGPGARELVEPYITRALEPYVNHTVAPS